MPKAVPFSRKERTQVGFGFDHRGTRYVHHGKVAFEETAYYRLNVVQVVVLISLAVIIVVGFILNWRVTAIALVALITLLYAVDMLFNLALIIKSLHSSADLKVTDKELKRLKDTNLPVYTILCPLYKEGRVLPQFVSSISALEYPKDKLQVLLLLEEDDTETLAAAHAANLPDYFEIVIVPHSLPKTKPKACNYGLKRSVGKYVVIYDAEDIPDPLQLKKVVVGFTKYTNEVACIQCKLNFYNPHTNALTRAFTSEYSLWFGLILPGLQAFNAPIPLGGTSNHFKRSVLSRIGGWDAFNVTEDADLGMRLVKRGYRTAIVDSVTLEEANSRAKSWFWQRTRWIKGYYQTYIVHTRRSGRATGWRFIDRLLFQIVIGGKMISILVNPIMWILTIGYIVLGAVFGPVLREIYPVPILYFAVLSLIAGNFLYVYYYMLGVARRGEWRLVKFAFLIPVYWLFMSFAAYYAVYELVRTPHKWRKTSHGIHLHGQGVAS